MTTAPLDTSTALSPLSWGSASTSSDRSRCPPGALASLSPGWPGPLAWEGDWIYLGTQSPASQGLAPLWGLQSALGAQPPLVVTQTLSG